MKNFSECGNTNYIYFHDSLFYNIAGYFRWYDLSSCNHLVYVLSHTYVFLYEMAFRYL